MVLEEDELNALHWLADGGETFEGPSDDEAEMNRAILMSIQDMRHVLNPGPSTAATGGSVGVEGGAVGGNDDDEVSEETINTLLNMGFERNRCGGDIRLIDRHNTVHPHT